MFRGLIILVMMMAVSPATARKQTTIQSASLPMTTTAASVGTEARPPIGWLGLCRDNPQECRINTSEPDHVTLTPDLWRKLMRINSSVNAEIKPVSDQDQWGVVEQWSLPSTGAGDCEDYALLKRNRLVEAGFPRRALLMTVVIDETGGGHAILTVRTNQGDYILDNKRNAIMPWQATGYSYVKRESQTSPGWVAMGEQSSSTTAGN